MFHTLPLHCSICGAEDKSLVVIHEPMGGFSYQCSVCNHSFIPRELFVEKKKLSPQTWDEMPDFDEDSFHPPHDTNIELEWPKLYWPSFSEGGYISNSDNLAIMHKSETIIPMDQAIELLENMSQSLAEITKILQESLKDAENK